VIAKHVPMRSPKRSDFAGLVSYLTNAQRKSERVGGVAVTNCHSDTSEVAITEVLNTQAQNTRAISDKTYHLILSFRAGGQPAEETLIAIETRVCQALGYGEHQRVSAVHHDTDHLHLHIAINKIHPSRYTLHDPYNDHKTLARECERLEREYGLEPDNHQARKCGAENRADDMERHTGIESLLGWIQRECQGQMQAAQSWAELHRVLRANGLQLRERGNGLTVTARDGTTVKASSISRDLSKNKLEARFGPFESLPEQTGHTVEAAARQYQQRPLRSRVNTAELYARYQAEQQNFKMSRALEWTQARERKSRLIEDAKRSGRLKRAAIKLTGAGRLAKKLMYASTSKTLRDEIRKTNQQYLEERQEIVDRCKRRAWADWLRAQAIDGDKDALEALRARDAARGLKGNTVTGTGRRESAHSCAVQDGITKHGTIIYRVGPSAVRDDGNRLSVSRAVTPEGLQATLRLAMQRYGNTIAVSGSAAFKQQTAEAAAAARLPLTFDDLTLERRRQQLLHLRDQAAEQERQHDRQERGPAGRARPGPVPAPVGRGGLGNVSELGVVRSAERGPVLLPRDVPRNVEDHAAESDSALRRRVDRPAGLMWAQAAADKIIAKRDAKRLSGLDPAKYMAMTVGDPVTVTAKGPIKRRARRP
jgi:hypothetical protein